MMDLSEAMKVHAEWKIKFRIAISKQETMDVATISADNCCALGKWLYGDGKIQFGHLQSHADCLTQHAQFHQEAGKVAQAINARQFNEAQAMIGPDTPFFVASGSVIMAIGTLKRDGNI